MEYYLYRHIRLDENTPFYIGIGRKRKVYNTYNQEYNRAYNRRNRNPFWKNIVSKTEYDVEILYESDSLSEINEKEKVFIKLYGRRDLGSGTLVNLTDGGEGTVNIVVPLERRRLISERNKGYKHSDEAKQKIAFAARTISDNTRLKMSNSRKGVKRVLSDEAKVKMLAGTLNSHKNRSGITSVTKNVIDTNTGIIYNSISECSKCFNVNAITLSRYLRGLRKTKYPNLKYYQE